MKNTFYLIFFIGIFLFGLTACKTVKTSSGAVLKVRSSKYLQKKLESQLVEVEWLTAKARGRFDDGSTSVKFSADIRMRKDSVIWMSMKKFGFEGARMLMTTDSVFLINRLEKTYVASDFSFIEKEYNLPANFLNMQRLFLGNPLIYTTENMQSSIEGEGYLLVAQNDDRISNDFRMDGLTYLLEQTLFKDQRYNREVLISQGNYEQLENNQPFAKSREIVLSSRETGTVDIDLAFSRVTVNQAAGMRFKIPGNYRRQ